MKCLPGADVPIRSERNSTPSRLLTNPRWHSLKARFIEEIAATSGSGTVATRIAPRRGTVAPNQRLNRIDRCNDAFHT